MQSVDGPVYLELFVKVVPPRKNLDVWRNWLPGRVRPAAAAGWLLACCCCD